MFFIYLIYISKLSTKKCRILTTDYIHFCIHVYVYFFLSVSVCLFMFEVYGSVVSEMVL